MEKSQRTENQVERAMASLDGIHRAASNPYLYNKIRERMSGKASSNNFWIRVQWVLSRPVVAMSMIIVLLVLNLLFIRSMRVQEKLSSSSESEQVLASEYNLAPSGFYDQTIASNE